jgi:hypothetical protein
MNCQRIQEHFLDYQAGALDAASSAEVRAHLSTCLTCQKEWSALQEITTRLDHLPSEEPGPRLREQFYEMLETHIREADAPSPFALAKNRLDRFFELLLPAQPAMQFALALALLAGGLYAGFRYSPRSAPATVTVVDDTAKKELAALRTRHDTANREIAALKTQMDSMGKLVTYSLLQQQSTGERMKNVLATMDLAQPDRQVLTDLVGALAFDPSVNVRLTAVEALAQHAGDELVRAGVLSALPRESAPLVQVAMIGLLTTAGERGAMPVFDRLARDEKLDRTVREAARRALAHLRAPAQQQPDPEPAAAKNIPKPSVA